MPAKCVLAGLVFRLVLAGPALAADSPIRYRIEFATCLGGEEWGQAREIIACPDGSLLIGAQAMSAQMPVTPGVVQEKYAGDDPGLGHPGIYGGDCYLVRLSGDGKKILAASYFGGSRQERNVYGMAVDSKGSVVITTATRSPDVPTTEGCFQKRYGGGATDILVAKLSADLRKLVWCTYVGGKMDESPRGGLALDASDNVYVVGTTNSPDFPTTRDVVGPRLNGPRDSFIVKLRANGSGLLFSTCLGGSDEDDAIMGIRLDADSSIYVAGHTKSRDFPVTDGAPQGHLGGQSDCYLAKVSPDGRHLMYSTYLGGTGNEFAEHRLALTPDGCMLLSGVTASPDFPTTNGAFQSAQKGRTDGFLTRLSANGKRWVFSTRVGGSENDNLLMPTLDARGNIYLVGNTGSPDWPTTSNALQRKFGGGKEDGVLAVVSPDGEKLLYCTYLGGRGDEIIRSIEFGAPGVVYLVGNTSSEDFPVTGEALQGDCRGKGRMFLVKLIPE
jgi:hypothetical protein